MRCIQVIGEITDDAFKRFSRKLRELESESDEPVMVELSSHGGEDYAALAFYGRIRTSPCEIHIHAFGQILSAATLIFAAGDYRIIDRECWFMVHDSTDRVETSVNGFKKHIQQMEAVETQWAQLLALRSITSAATWRKLSASTTFLDAITVMQLGLADKISKDGE